MIWPAHPDPSYNSNLCDTKRGPKNLSANITSLEVSMQSPAILGSERTLVSSKRQFERAKSGTHIVFDVGMNNGDDSTHYLSKGYQVVAIEANPILVERARARFQKEIAAGQILIECVGIVI
ncbi:MAG: hypothetical protein DMG87_17645 [Acidobacteria bacterium]|nr:MAG: hypothetical protein DMG87_17645 [Acidobacteriota bacterium]